MANKNTGLGKGLSALLGDDFSLNPPQAPSALPISQVESCAGQPRKRFDQEKLESWRSPSGSTALSSPSPSASSAPATTRSSPGSAAGGPPGWRA